MESDDDEIANGTLPLNPDTDGDGFCDGINAVAGVCFAGPDPYPNDPNLPLDTDGDGLPDDDSGWTGPPYADDDDDNDGFQTFLKMHVVRIHSMPTASLLTWTATPSAMVTTTTWTVMELRT